MKQIAIRTSGHAQALGIYGPHGPKDTTPRNRKELRAMVRSAPRELRRGVFGRWRRRGLPVEVDA